MKQLEKILLNVETIKIIGKKDININNINFDSRKIEKNDLFFAIKGTQVDGHNFIQNTIELGATAIVLEHLPENINQNVTYVLVEDSSKTLGIVSSNYYNNPSEKLKLVGVTGTNGKTTIATTLYKLFLELGYSVGLFSTVRNYINNEAIDSTHTTPDQIQLNKTLNKMVELGCEYCFMEVSSHSIVQNRIAGLHFTGGIFTNITHDHLDFHKTFEEYLKAKKMFFDNLPATSFAISNADDKNGKVMLQNCKAQKQYYSLKNMSEFKTKILESDFNGTLLNFNGSEVYTKFVGEFNAYNLSAIIGTAVLLKQDLSESLTALSKLTHVDGRFETFISKSGITAIVDYAHTPDALVNVIKTINIVRGGNGRLITVVGAGGNRDKTKRPIMAKVASENSDRVILTSDNPRFEKPEDILNDMIQGVEVHLKKNLLVISDRKEAIKTAFMLATNGDVILVAGKGHEAYQEINGVKYHFDDKEIIKENIDLC